MVGHVLGVHVDDGQQASAEHALPLALFDVLAVVGAGECFGCPFLLEECSGDKVRDGSRDSSKVEEVVLVPSLANSLLGVAERWSVTVSTDNGSRGGQKAGEMHTPFFKLW